jgi:hypothetical protein
MQFLLRAGLYVYTKLLNSSKIWKALEWTILIIFTTIFIYVWPFGLFHDNFAYF